MEAVLAYQEHIKHTTVPMGWFGSIWYKHLIKECCLVSSKSQAGWGMQHAFKNHRSFPPGCLLLCDPWWTLCGVPLVPSLGIRVKTLQRRTPISGNWKCALVSGPIAVSPSAFHHSFRQYFALICANMVNWSFSGTATHPSSETACTLAGYAHSPRAAHPASTSQPHVASVFREVSLGSRSARAGCSCAGSWSLGGCGGCLGEQGDIHPQLGEGQAFPLQGALGFQDVGRKKWTRKIDWKWTVKYYGRVRGMKVRRLVRHKKGKRRRISIKQPGNEWFSLVPIFLLKGWVWSPLWRDPSLIFQHLPATWLFSPLPIS